MRTTAIPSHSWKRTGVTFLELLIVVTVLAVLVLIAFPLMGNLRARAQAAACVSALRQIMTAELAFGVDNQNQLVPYQVWKGETVEGGYRYWSGLLFPYIIQSHTVSFSSGLYGNNRWFMCPGQKTKRPDGSVPPGLGPVFTDWKKGHLLHSMPYSGGPGGVPSKKRAQVAHPAKTASWMDVQGGSSTGFPAYCRGCYPKGGIASASNGVSDGNNFADRHFKGANVGFVDGHVQWISFEELRREPTAEDPGIWHHHDDL